MTPPPSSQPEGAVVAPFIPSWHVEPELDVPVPVEVKKPSLQWKRLAFHVLLIGLAAYLCVALDGTLWRYTLTIVALVLGSLYEIVRVRYGGWLTKLFNWLQGREEEKLTRTASMDFLVAMGMCVLLFSPAVSATAFLVVALADPFARVFGMTFGRTRWPRSRKTYVGSLACFLTSLVTIVSCMRGAPLHLCIAAAVVATIAELIPHKIYQTWFGPLPGPSDNFYMPVLTSCVLAWGM